MTLALLAARQGQVSGQHLDALTLTTAGAARLAQDLHITHDVDGVFILNTCQRTEIYLDSTDPATSLERARSLWSDTAQVDGPLPATLTALTGLPVATHLFRVVAGLESLAVGEQHIVAQVREALGTAQQGAWLGTELNSLVQAALRVNGHIRRSASLTAAPSLLQVGLTRAQSWLGPGRKDILVVGSGTVGREAAITATDQGHRVTVWNRTPERAAVLAGHVGGTLARPNLRASLQEADVVVCATSAPHPVITAPDVRNALAVRGRARQVYIDVGRPRNVAVPVGTLPDVLRLGVGDLGTTPSTGWPAGPEQQAVAAAVQAWTTDRASAEAGPVIQTLRARAAAAVSAEVARSTRRNKLDPTAQALLRASLRRVTNQLLHAPTVRAVSHAADGSLPLYEALLADVFKVDQPVQETRPTANRKKNPGHDSNPEEVPGPASNPEELASRSLHL